MTCRPSPFEVWSLRGGLEATPSPQARLSTLVQSAWSVQEARRATLPTQPRVPVRGVPPRRSRGVAVRSSRRRFRKPCACLSRKPRAWLSRAPGACRRCPIRGVPHLSARPRSVCPRCVHKCLSKLPLGVQLPLASVQDAPKGVSRAPSLSCLSETIPEPVQDAPHDAPLGRPAPRCLSRMPRMPICLRCPSCLCGVPCLSKLPCPRCPQCTLPHVPVQNDPSKDDPCACPRCPQMPQMPPRACPRCPSDASCPRCPRSPEMPQQMFRAPSLATAGTAANAPSTRLWCSRRLQRDAIS